MVVIVDVDAVVMVVVMVVFMVVVAVVVDVIVAAVVVVMSFLVSCFFVQILRLEMYLSCLEIIFVCCFPVHSNSHHLRCLFPVSHNRTMK